MRKFSRRGKFHVFHEFGFSRKNSPQAEITSWHRYEGMNTCSQKKKEIGLLSQAENKELSKDNDGRRVATITI